MDHLGPFVKSKEGHQYVIALQDGFTKYCFLEPVAETSTKGVIKALKAMAYLFGVPRRLICDRGTAFTSRAMKAFCNETGIQLVINSLNLPRANGQVERLNRTILNTLNAIIRDEPEENWCEALAAAQQALNNSVNKVTGRTPNELLFGYKPIALCEALLVNNLTEAGERLDLRVTRAKARELLDEDQKRQMRRFNARRYTKSPYKPGDIVLIRISKGNPGYKKLKGRFRSIPYKVLKVLKNDRFEVLGTRPNGSTHRVTVTFENMRNWPAEQISD